MITINKYIVNMYEKGREKPSRSLLSYGRSEDDAINNILTEKGWYDDGVGIDRHRLTYPLSFKAEIIKD